MTTAALRIAVAGAPSIPGLTLRRFAGDDDYAAMAELFTTTSLADEIDFIPDADILRVDYSNWAGFEPTRDIVLAEVESRLVAAADVTRQVRDGVAVYTTACAVHPEFRRRGLGRALLRYLEAHGRALAESYDDPGGRALGTWTHGGDGGAERLLEQEGYRPVRYGFGMRKQGLGELPAVELPGGLVIREVTPDHHRAIFDADEEAFRDHWGHRETTEEDFERLFGMPDLDTALWSVAWDGDDVVGSVQGMIWKTENETLGVRRGWLERISVRRPWRRKGVARALIVDALRRLRDADMDEAMLGVDSQNPTGALQLYESLGFEVKDRGTTYRKDW
jgi:mycothiol synthase